MVVEIKELCLFESEHGESEGIRTVVYEISNMKADSSNIGNNGLLSVNITLDILEEYEENFDNNNIISSEDDFDGACLDTLGYESIKILS